MKPRRAHPVIILLVVLLCLAPGVQALDGVDTDKAALVALYNATDGANWTPNTNWTSTETLSAWHGVTTNSDGRVTRLELNDNGLDGTLPAALGDLSALEYLDLQNNALSGALPAELADLTNLEELLLNESRALTGPLPDGLRELSGVETVNIENTELCAPDGDAFLTWLDTITFSGLICPPAEQSVIDVAVFYTSAARENAGGTTVEIATAIDLMVASANTAYTNSGVNQRVSLVAVEEVSYTEETRQIDFSRFRTASDGYLDEVQDIRNRVAADINVLIRRDSSTTLAYNNAQPMTTMSEMVSGNFGYYAYAYVDILSPDVVFAHELGHVMGLAHDRYVACRFNTGCQPRVFPYAYGYVNQQALEEGAPASARWRTIMSYDDQCVASGISCSRVLYFSSPDRTYEGDPMGIAGFNPTDEITGPSDASRTLNRTRRYVANFFRAPAITVSFGAVEYTATEGGTTATVTVKLSDVPTRPIVIPVTSRPTTGATTSDYTVPDSLSFHQFATKGTLTVLAVNDTADDDGESVTLAFGEPLPTGVTTSSPAMTIVNLIDNDVVSSAPSILTLELSSESGSDRTYAAEDEIQVTVTFSETVEVTGTPQLTLELGGGRRTATYGGGSGTAALVFAYEVADGESDTDGVGVEADSLSGGTIRDGSNNDAVLDHDGLAADAGHKVAAVKPELAATGGAVVDGTTLTLIYDEPLDRSSTPVPGDFTVSGGDRARTVTGVRLNGSAVELTLDVGAEHLEAGIQVSYTSGTNPIRDVPGNDAEALSREPVTNETPDSTAPTVRSLAIISNPGSDQTYAAGDEIEVTVRLSETVEVEGTPRLRLKVGTRIRTADYETGTGTAVLVFAYEVADGDDDTDGVSIEAGRIALNRGTIEDEAENAADLAHGAVVANAGHKVDGVRPAFVSTAVDGASLTLTYGEALDEGSRPASGDFTVQVDGSGRSVSGVSVSGSVVLLTVDPAVEHGETGIRVSYRPGTNPILDAVGNDAVRLNNERVTNNTGDTTAPTVSRVETTSRPERNATYAAGQEIAVTVTFSETVVVTGTPRLRLNVGGVSRTAAYRSGTGAAAVFVYVVADGESDTDGVSIEANSLTLNGGRIRDGANNNALLTHDGLAANAGHKVDGVKPALAANGGAVVNGTTLTLTFGERLDGSSTPQASAFTVTGGDTSRTVTDVALSGSAVLLTVDPAVEHGETGIRVSYTVPTGTGSIPLQDVLGNDADRLSNVPVTNETPDTTSPTVSKLEITSDPGTDRTYAAGDEIRVTVTFSEPVDVERTPRLMLKVGDRNRPAGYLEGTGTTELVFGYEVADGDEDTDGVSVEAGRLTLNGGTIRDSSNNNAVLDHDGLAANSGHKVDGAGPDLAETGGAVVNGTTLTLTYDEALDGGSRPVSGDFTVSGGDRVRAVTGVRVNGSGVELTLDVGAEHGEAGILVSYTVPTGMGANPIRDVPGNDAKALSRESVTNETPDTTSPEVSILAITSNPGSDRTYAAGDEIEVTVTFSETVEVEGTPQLRLRVGSRTRTAGYLRGKDTAALVFGYEVADGDEDTDGVSIEANRLSLNGVTIEDAADNPADLDHEAVAPQAGHKVDGVRPAFLSAAVDGASLTLTYGEALDGGVRPATGDFTVQVDGAGRSVSGVSVSGSVVILTLNPAVEHGDTGIRVSYTPGTNPIQDTAGNDAVRLSNESVTNTTGAPNTAPQITSPESFDVRENQAMVRRLAAGDTDPGDEVTGWSIVGGADRFQFSIASDTGVLSFRTAPDYEDPRDTDSSDPVSGAGDNEYVVTVEARSGTGARQLEMEQTIAVRVTDEREPPAVPEAPTFSGETADSLQVSWSEPDNTGPPITDYDVQYLEKGTGRFIDAQHAGPGLALTLADLKVGTVYEAQVRATNDEGMSEWSESGEGRTVTPLIVQMTTGLPPPVEGPFTVRFSFSETVRGFTLSDIETQQEPACTDNANNPVSCNPGFAALQTTDDRIFTTTVTPVTDGVAHNYTLTITVPASRVTSAVDNKPNEAATLEVRIAPPGVTAPISSIGLRGNAGNGQVTLSWNTPADPGGDLIVRYEYRYRAEGEEWSDWENATARARGVTVENLINGREYVFEARAVNALGKGPAETAMETPVHNAGTGTGGGGGGGGGSPPARPTVNTDPVITTPGPFDVAENQMRVVRIEALDTDPGDAIRSYAIAGGADGNLFSIVAHTGVLSFREPPNFEAPADVGSTDPPSGAGDNEYIVVVRVASGPLSRDRTVEQAFAVRVTDADRESPGAPDRPRLTRALDSSLTVEWAEPENPGPLITDYDVQYREGPSGFFINAPHEGPGRTATLTGLEAATLYQVQVRASNEEGTGRWSELGEGLTLAGPAAMLPFAVPDRGGISFTSQGTSPELRVGYGQVETDAGMTPPAGLAILGSRVNGVLVSEAGVPAVPPVLEGRIFAETDGAVRTGLALANPNDAPATVAFFFTDSEGSDFGHSTFTLRPREQIARFLDEAPFNGGSAMFGTFTFTADLPVAVIALRGFVNERSEFLMTTLPVAPLAVPTTGTVYFPHFADGGSWTTQVILVNPTHAPISGSVQFFGPGSETEAAAPATLTLADGRNGSTFSYAIPPRSAIRLRTSNPAGPLRVGSVRAVPDPGQPAPSGVSIFTFQKDGTTVSEAGVPASTAGTAFRLYVEASGTPGQPHSVRSGIALTNTSDALTMVSLELTDLDGTATGLPESLTIPASGHIARFIDEFFPALTTPFSGILRITATAPDIAAVGLRLAINQRHDILVTTTPPADENAAPTASDLFFPHFVDSAGWTTQFILFSRSPGQTAAGMIRFTGQDGQLLELSVAPTAAPTIP